ncbi:MAG: DNA primase [Bacilli bacterium]|nr:DNA primase [Bacilli bacterium]
MLDKSLIDEISKKADIVTVVGSYLNLVKKGRMYVALCPFHDDSNPSLQVNPERNTFHCWVDGHSGNAISFVMQYEHVNFIEAVKKVADIIGYDDPRLHEKTYVKKIDDNLVPLIKCIDDLNLFYEYSLTSEEGKDAIDYLNKRHISSEAIKKFHIGYSLKDGIKTIKFLQSKGHSLKTIEDIGVTTNLGENTHDNNQGRLTFALLDNVGQVVGFSARHLNDGDGPKYVNSPETKLFTKGKIFYNFYQAKDIAKNERCIYLLEGFMDVIALDKIDVNNAIALMGTALSKDHIQVLKKLNVEVRLCLDGDLPGQEASMRILPLLLNNNIETRIVNNLNDERDPDEILNENGADALKKYLNNLLSPFDFIINFYKNSKKLDTAEEKKKLIARFLPLLLATNSQLEFDDYIYKLADVTGFSFNAIKKAVANARNKKTNNEIEIDEGVNPSNLISIFHPERKELRRLEKAEREILYHMLTKEDAITFYEKNIEYFYTDIYRDIANYILDYRSRNSGINLSGLISDIEMKGATNKEKVKQELNNLINEKIHLKFSNKLLNNCQKVIEKEKKIIYRKEKIAKATEGKTEEEKARIIADTLRVDKK